MWEKCLNVVIYTLKCLNLQEKGSDDRHLFFSKSFPAINYSYLYKIPVKCRYTETS